jgi:formylglycine-generating enzyme required for sulfatase activity
MQPTLARPPVAKRADLVERYRRNRARSRVLFDLLAGDEAYYSRPIALRHPIVFYEGHLPAFSFNTLIKAALGQPSIDPELEALFARGIDPDTTSTMADEPPERIAARWPRRDVIRAFADEADARIVAALEGADLEIPGHRLLDRAEAVFTILEHEVMHQETLLYMWHRLPFSQKRAPAGYRPQTTGVVPPLEWIDVPPARATIGVDRGTIPFGWDNEFPAYTQEVAAFAISRHNVTNAEYLEFVEAGAASPIFWEYHDDRWYWRGMFDLVPLPLAWPVYVTHADASAYARWRGARLPSEAEFQRAAYGTPDDDERRFPWGDAEPTPSHGCFDFASWDPHPVGTHASGRSAWSVDDLVGNGWEWTRTVFAPFPGFTPSASYPQYSSDFFDGDHFVMKGASPATGRELLRPTFRNWFRPRYPYVYASFRCLRDAR